MHTVYDAIYYHWEWLGATIHQKQNLKWMRMSLLSINNCNKYHIALCTYSLCHAVLSCLVVINTDI